MTHRRLARLADHLQAHHTVEPLAIPAAAAGVSDDCVGVRVCVCVCLRVRVSLRVRVRVSLRVRVRVWQGKKTRYAVVGLGGRSVMYSGAILSTYAERAELVGICDINPERMQYYLRTTSSERAPVSCRSSGSQSVTEP